MNLRSKPVIYFFSALGIIAILALISLMGFVRQNSDQYNIKYSYKSAGFTLDEYQKTCTDLGGTIMVQPVIGKLSRSHQMTIVCNQKGKLLTVDTMIEKSGFNPFNRP